MSIQKIVRELNDKNIRKAFREIETWEKAEELGQESILMSVHSTYENEMGSKIPLQLTIDVILFEIGKRYASIF